MFEVGEKVICIDSSIQPHMVEELRQDMPNWISKGTVYTVRGFTSNDGIVDGMWLEEVVNVPKFFRLINRVQEPAFALWRFSKSESHEVEHSIEQVEEV